MDEIISDEKQINELNNNVTKKKPGRPKKYTEEEALELKRERNRILCKNKYHTDEKYRENKKQLAREKTKIYNLYKTLLENKQDNK